MKLLKKAGATSEIWQIFVQDSSSTTGAGLAGLAFNSASLTAYYHRDTDTTATAITLATMTVGTFTSSGFKEIDATNMPGWYQFCPPNAAIAAGAKSCAFLLKGATNMAPVPIECQLMSVNPDDGAFGLLLDSANFSAAAENAFADAYLDRANAIETGITPRIQMKVSVAADAGKTNGMNGATGHVRDYADTLNRITATLDGAGNRTATTIVTT